MTKEQADIIERLKKCMDDAYQAGFAAGRKAGCDKKCAGSCDKSASDDTLPQVAKRRQCGGCG